MRFLPLSALAVLVVLAGCREIEDLRDRLAPATPHEAYARALDDAGLGGSALAVAWRDAAARALAQPVDAELPFDEIAYFDPARPGVAGYAFPLRRGDRFRARLVRRPGDTTKVFLDLFEVPDDTLRAPRRVAGAPSPTRPDTLEVSFEPRRDATFVLRVQPELLRGGRMRVEAWTEPSFAVFPVSGKDRTAIRSFWGAPRDGGERSHQGIDIFAPRGTPAVAAASGTVSLRNGGLGGKTVWLRTDRGSLYYAHLDSQLVRQGQRVSAGDTLGWVGNTGNARTTPPHLHFGIYSRGAIDPLPFVDWPRPDPPPLRADTASLGTWARLTRRADVGPAGTPLRIVGAMGSLYRVVDGSGVPSYVADRSLTTRPLRTTRLAGVTLRDRPDAEAPLVDSVATETAFDVIGAMEDYTLVRARAPSDEPQFGWVRK